MAAIKRRNLESRFALLEDRVFKIELRLGPEAGAAAAAPAPAVAEPFTIVMPVVLETAALAEAQAEAEPKETLESLASHLLREKSVQQSHAAPPPLPIRTESAAGAELSPATVQPIQISYAAPVSIAPIVQGKLERTIGLKWAGWAGAILFVIGAAFGVKYAYSQHWFGHVPPQVWLGAIFAAGLGMIGVGDLVYRRVHVIPAASVFGAGIATLFLAGYVGNAYYDLYSPGTALFLMAAAALVGALVAMRGNLVSIAVLSHIGANIAPVLVGSRNAPLESFLVYLLALQMVALSLASWGRGKKWWTLRGLSLATTAIWVISAGLRPGEEYLAFVFSVFYALLYQGELLISAMRDRDDSTPAFVGPDAVTFSLLVSALLTGAILWVTRSAPPGLRGIVILIMSGIFAAAGWAILRLLRHTPKAVKQISTAHRIVAAALLALAVPVAYSGLRIDCAWCLLALAFAVAGAKTKSPIARTSGIIAWFLAIFHLAIAPHLASDLNGYSPAIWFTLFGTVITRDAGVAFALSMVGQIIAALNVDRAAQSNRSAISISLVASAIWVATSVVALPPLAATGWIVEYAWLLVAAEALVPQLRFSMQAATLLMIATVKWAIIDTLADRLSPGWSAASYRPFFNPMMGIGALLCASIVTLYSIRRKVLWRGLREADSTVGLIGVLTILFALITFGVSMEIDRALEQMFAAGSLQWPLWQAKQLAWTIAWTLSAASAFALFRWRDPNAHPAAAWPRVLPHLVTLLAIKFLLVDTVLWRLLHNPANVPVLTNLECAAGAAVFAALAMIFVIGLPVSLRDGEPKLKRFAGMLGALILLWTGSIEIDRYFAAANVFNGPIRPEQVALSIYWSIFAVACVLLGFRTREAALRYFGLGLLAVTMLKVVLIDMSQVQAGYRILSFMGLGAFMLGTSVVYGKFGPRLLHDEEPASPEEPQVSVG